MADHGVTRLVNIDVNASGVGTAEVMGADVSRIVSAVEVHADPNGGAGTTVVFRMRPDRLRVEAEADVRLAEETAEALRLLGWTAPGDELVATLEVTETVEVDESQFVLTWVPLVASDDGEPVEIPLNEHLVLPQGIGELRLSTRDVLGGESCH